MKEYRNAAFKQELWLHAAGTAILTAIGFILSPAAGILMLVAGCFYTLLHLLYTRRRYRDIAALGAGIDRVLHGQQAVLISDSAEGELAILAGEIQKMTVRLREQSDQLLADKRRLTDAIADIFHQLRTPLTAMNLTVSLLEREELSDERRLQLTRDLKRQLERIGWLVETLLKMSKIDAGAVRFAADTLSVRQLLESAAAPFVIPMELRGQTLHITATDERMTGDAAWTIEAVGNLLKNAMEHTPPGGAVWVTAAETALYTEIVVRDSGPGFEKEDLPHLFERFYRGKGAAADSVGIGLALTRMIVTAQNGTIAADNPPEGGARFTLRFYKSVV